MTSPPNTNPAEAFLDAADEVQNSDTFLVRIDLAARDQGDPDDPDEAYYFERKGCDNAALLAAGPVSYLILTNGTP